MTVKRRQAPELIATLIGWDWSDVKANVYQPTRYASPRVYVIGEGYMCAPTARQTLPANVGAWEVAGSAYGRPVYRTKEGPDDAAIAAAAAARAAANATNAAIAAATAARAAAYATYAAACEAATAARAAAYDAAYAAAGDARDAANAAYDAAVAAADAAYAAPTPSPA